MPLGRFVENQLDELRAFMEFPGQSMRVIQHDPDIKPVLLRLLAALDDDESNPHILAMTRVPLVNHDQFFEDLLVELSEQNEQSRSGMAAAGVDLPQPADAQKRNPARARLEHYVSAVAEALPDCIGSYVVIIDPEHIDDESAFAKAMTYLAEQTSSMWAKYIVLDGRQNPLLGEIDQRTERASIQLFHLSPGQIEEQVKLDLQGGSLSPAERRQYAAMMAAFAAAKHDYAEAETIQLQCLKMAEDNGSPAEQANILYNLGNTYLETGQLPEAKGCYTRAAEICVGHKINPLLAVVLTNLGVVLQRLGQADQSMESFAVARRTFKAIGNRPGEAYVLDCQASTLALEKRNVEAEEAWLEALAIYDGITSNVLQDVRDSGRNDILDKLKRFYESTDQRQKIDSLDPSGSRIA